MNKLAIIFLATILPFVVRGEVETVRTVSHTDAAVLLKDDKLLNHQMELISLAGGITIGKFRGIRDGALLLQDTAPVSLCDVRLVRISRKTASLLRRGLGITGGLLGGLLLGGPVALSIAYSGAETTGLITYMVFPIVGAVAGAKLVRNSKDTVYLLDRDPSGTQCDPVP